MQEQHLASRLAAVAESIRSVDDILKSSVAASTTGAIAGNLREPRTASGPRREEERVYSRRVASDIVPPSNKHISKHGRHDRALKERRGQTHNGEDPGGEPRLTYERLQQYAIAHAKLTAPPRPGRSTAGSAILRKLATTATAGLIPSPQPQPQSSVLHPAAAAGPLLGHAASTANLPPHAPSMGARLPMTAPGMVPFAAGPRPSSARRPLSARVLLQRLGTFPQQPAPLQQAPQPQAHPAGPLSPPGAPPPERAFGPRASDYPSRPRVSLPSDPSPTSHHTHHQPRQPVSPHSPHAPHPPPHHPHQPPHSNDPRTSPSRTAGAGWQPPPPPAPSPPPPPPPHGPASPRVPSPQRHSGGRAATPVAPSPAHSPPRTTQRGPGESPGQEQQQQQQQQQHYPPQQHAPFPQQQPQQEPPPQPPQPPPPQQPQPSYPSFRPHSAAGGGLRPHSAAGGGVRWGAPRVVGLRDVPPSQLPHARAVVLGGGGDAGGGEGGDAEQQRARFAGAHRGSGRERRSSDGGTHASWWQGGGDSEASYPMTAVTDRYRCEGCGEDELSPSEAAQWLDRMAQLEAEVLEERESRRRYEAELARLAAAAASLPGGKRSASGAHHSGAAAAAAAAAGGAHGGGHRVLTGARAAAAAVMRYRPGVPS